MPTKPFAIYHEHPDWFRPLFAELERRGIPFVIAVNCFEGSHRYEADEVRRALDVDDAIPVVLCDARERESSKAVLVSLIQHTMDRLDATV